MFAKRMLSLILALAMGLSMTAAAAETAVDTILAAGTTQAFTDEAVSEDDLTVILEAGLSATSAINQQPWYFVVVTNKDMMEEIGGSMGFGAPPAGAPAGMPAGAPPAGMPAGAPPAPPAGGGSAKAAMGDSPAAIILYKNDGTPSPDASFDCGLACQNMVIAAAALGYGTKIVSSPTMALNGDNHDALCEKLGVDPAYQAVAVLLIGREDTSVDGSSGASVRSAMSDKVNFVD